MDRTTDRACLASWIRVAGYLACGLPVAPCLFRDTYHRHFGAPRADRPIRFAHFGGYEDFELWRSVVADYNAGLHSDREPGDLPVRQEYVVGLTGHYETKLRQQILSSTLPDLAVIQLDTFRALGEHFGDLGDPLGSGDARDATPDVQPRDALGETDPSNPPSDAEAPASLDTGALAAFRIDGWQRGWLISGGNLLIYVNADCFRRAARGDDRPGALPSDDWSIEDFQRTAEALTRDFDDDNRVDQFGFWLPRWV